MIIKNIKEHTFIDKGFSDNPATIVDLGACLGEFCNDFVEMFGSVKKSILIEANPTNFNKIITSDNIIAHNNFISSEEGGSVIFREDPTSPYNGTSVFSYFENSVDNKIDNITLNEIIRIHDLEKIDILKIDIEGAEYDILENIDPELFKIIDQITVEFHDFIDPELKERTSLLVKKIESYGYETISNSIDYKYGSDYYDTLFYKK